MKQLFLIEILHLYHGQSITMDHGVSNGACVADQGCSVTVDRLQCNGMHCKHDSDCTKFYQIVHGKPVERPCAPGTRFNVAIGVCDHPYNVECTAGFKTEISEPPQSQEKAQQIAISCDCAGTWNDANLAGIYTFVEMYRNYPVYKRDQNTIDGKAVYLYNAECDGDDTWFMVSGEAYQAKSYDNAWMMLESSMQYVVNLSGVWHDLSNGYRQAIQWTFKSTSAKTNPANNIVTVDNLQCNGMHCQHESDCTKFYQIVHGEPVERPCAPGTRFNLALGVCDWPRNVECTAGFKSGIMEPPKNEEKVNVDRLQCNGMHCKHESDCTKYYQIVEMPCAPGTQFNLALGVCDHPDNVECTAGLKPKEIALQLTNWSGWSACSLSCGGGQRTRSRSCLAGCDKLCQHGSGLLQTQACNEQACPVKYCIRVTSSEDENLCQHYCPCSGPHKWKGGDINLKLNGNTVATIPSGFSSFDHCFWSDQFDKINDRISLENTNNDGACITGVIVDGKQMLFGKNGNLQSFWMDGDQNNCYENYLGTNQITIQNGQVVSSYCDV